MKDGADARTQLELALVKAADPARDASHKALLARLERLERGAPAPAAPPPVPKAPEAPQTAAGLLFAKPPSQPTVTTIDTPTDGPAIVAAVEVEMPDAAPETEPAVAVAVAPVDESTELRELWPAVLEQLEGSLKAMLGETVPLGVEDNRLTVAFSESAMLMFRHADKPANREAVAAAVRAVTGRAIAVRYELRSDDEMETDADEPLSMSEHDLVDRMMHEFDATEEEPPAL